MPNCPLTQPVNIFKISQELCNLEQNIDFEIFLNTAHWTAYLICSMVNTYFCKPQEFCFMHMNLFTLSQHRFQAEDQPQDINIKLIICSYFRFSQ